MAAWMKARGDFFLIIALSALLQTNMISGLYWLGYLEIPLGMVRVYFHEMGHGISALLSGGHFYQIELAFGQGGLAHTDGTQMLGDKVTLFGGYLGESVWGLLIYMTFTRWLRERFDLVPYLCMGITGVSLLLWARDIRTIGIIVFIMAVFQCIGRLDSDRQMYWAVKFLSVYLIMGGALDPYMLYHYDYLYDPGIVTISDGRALADLSFHNEAFWVHCWMAASGAAFAVVLAMEWLFTAADASDWSGTA